MHKTIRETFEAWDLKSFLLTILFLSIGLFLFFYFDDIRDRIRTDDKENFKGQTTGEIISIEPIERISQSRWKGTKIYVNSYKVSYSYNINGQVFQNIDIIPVTTKNKKFLQRLLAKGANDTFLVNFDLKAPRNSVLVEIN